MTDFHSLVFSDWTENLLLMCENVAVNLNKTLCVTKTLLSKLQSAPKILMSGNQPLSRISTRWKNFEAEKFPAI